MERGYNETNIKDTVSGMASSSLDAKMKEIEMKMIKHIKNTQKESPDKISEGYCSYCERNTSFREDKSSFEKGSSDPGSFTCLECKRSYAVKPEIRY